MSVLRSSHRRREARDTLGDARRPLRCTGCGYEIASYRSLPVCPMCRETVWEPAPWRPFTRRRP
jgi:hypothetical protein